MKIFLKKLLKHPLGALYGALLGIVAFSAVLPMFSAGMADAALVDLAMAALLIAFMLKSFISTEHRHSFFWEKCSAWGLLVLADILALIPTHDFPGSLSTAFAFSLLICAAVLYFSGWRAAADCIAPALWCCVFIPYHEELMLMLGFALRLSATMLSAGLLKLCGISVVYSGTTLALPGLDIAITDACSGINQLDAFILIAFIAVQMMQKKSCWKILHFAFIVPAIIAGNSLRIAATVLLFRLWGETILQNTWHMALGYVQIVLALAIFLGIGKLFSALDGKIREAEK